MAQTAKRKIFDDRYEILSIVGRGARSVVYHARHVKDPNTEVALKVLLEQKGKISNPERLRKEALALVSARHRSVIRLDDFHSVGSLCYLSLEYAPEADLRRYSMKIGGVLPPEFAERFLMQTAEALAFVHKVGIIHRDVKPENILVINQNEVRLADFGVAVLPGDTASLEDLQSGVGTMNYLAPEVLDGKAADPRSDLYSLAVTFYELISGLNPFEKSSLAQQVEARRDENVPRLLTLSPKTPPHLSAAIMQAMSFDPEARFATIREFIQAILIGKSKPAETQRTTKNRTSQPSAARARERLTADIDPSQTTSIDGDKNLRHQDLTSQKSLSHEVSVDEDLGTAEERTQAMPKYDPPPLPVKQASDEVGETVVVSSPKPPPTSVTSTVYAPGGLKELVDALPKQPPSKPARKASASDIAATVNIPIESTAAASASSGPSDTTEISDPTQTAFIPQSSVEEAKRSGLQRIREKQGKRTARRTQLADTTSNVAMHPRMNLNKLAALGTGAGIFVALILVAFSGLLSPSSEVGDGSDLAAVFVPPIPPVTAQDYAFPDLPPGMYVGSISNLLPGRKVPLTLLSIPRQAVVSDASTADGAAPPESPKTELSVVLGVDGWMPSPASPRASTATAGAPMIVRTTSNGYILEFAAQTVYGELYGTYRNLVTGTHGEWRARPVNPKTDPSKDSKSTEDKIT